MIIQTLEPLDSGGRWFSPANIIGLFTLGLTVAAMIVAAIKARAATIAAKEAGNQVTYANQARMAAVQAQEKIAASQEDAARVARETLDLTRKQADVRLEIRGGITGEEHCDDAGHFEMKNPQAVAEVVNHGRKVFIERVVLCWRDVQGRMRSQTALFHDPLPVGTDCVKYGPLEPGQSQRYRTLLSSAESTAEEGFAHAQTIHVRTQCGHTFECAVGQTWAEVCRSAQSRSPTP